MQQVDDVVEDSEPERERRRRRDDVTEGESDNVLELSRFAYKSASRAPPPTDGPSRPASVIKKDTPDHLPDSQLFKQLSKCIGCGLQWTSRKAAKQKRKHIEQCAKKNALTEDTIRILIEKEIAILSPTQNTTTATLMDSVVPIRSAKKSKRQQVVPTVKSLPETCGRILDRARDILGPTKGQTDPQPTQQFGQSALARRNTQQPMRSALLDVNRSMEEPPPTQPFGASSLRRGMTAERSVEDYEESSFLPTQQFGVSKFAQDSVLPSDRHKRPASPPPLMGSDSRTVRRRLL